MRILIVHQERAIADTLAEYLHNQGHQVLPLYCPYDALNHFLEIVHFDLALISSGLPDLNEELPVLFADSVMQPGCRVFLLGTGDSVENRDETLNRIRAELDKVT
jgi:DNA-binding response OmpR family regulator